MGVSEYDQNIHRTVKELIKNINLKKKKEWQAVTGTKQGPLQEQHKPSFQGPNENSSFIALAFEDN